MHWVATECSRNDRSKTQYYVVILDRLQGRSRAWALESRIRGPLTVCVEVSPLCFLPTIVCAAADSVVYQVTFITNGHLLFVMGALIL